MPLYKRAAQHGSKWSSELLNRFRPKPDYDFRVEYTQPASAVINWYPGHMTKALRQLKETFIPRTHVIVEVRDIRIPMSSNIPKLQSLIKSFNRKHMIVYNKVDLLPEKEAKRAKGFLKRYHKIHHPDSPLIFVDGRDKDSVGGIVYNLKQLARTKYKSLPTVAAVLGLPNVGKSTLLNSLRRFNFAGGAKVAPIPGVTRSISTFKLIGDPPINMMDTPGLFVPALDVDNYLTGMNCALCNSIPESAVGKTEICDYLLFQYNKRREFGYVEACKLQRPTDDIHRVLTVLATKKRWLYDGHLDIPYTADRFLKMYRDADLPCFVLDDLDFSSLDRDEHEPQARMQDGFTSEFERILSDCEASDLEFLEPVQAKITG